MAVPVEPATTPRYSYFLRVDAERCKQYMRERRYTEATLAARIGAYEKTIYKWKIFDWPEFSLCCTLLQVNPIALLVASQNPDDGKWTVQINSQKWLFHAQRAGYSVNKFAAAMRVQRGTIMRWYNNSNPGMWSAIENLAYGLEVSPLALLRVDER